LKTIPNDHKSEAGKWYDFDGQIKVEEVEKDFDQYDHNEKQPVYRISLKIPSKYAVGIHKKECVISGVERNWATYYYQGLSDPIPKAMMNMSSKIRDLNRQLNELKQRNHALELHFTRTRFEEDLEYSRRKKEKEECQYCYKEIEKTKQIEGRDWFYLNEDGIMHINCGVKCFDSICTECNAVFEADYCEEDGCPNCDGRMRSAKKKEIKEHLVYNAIKRYLPNELQNKVVMKE